MLHRHLYDINIKMCFIKFILNLVLIQVQISHPPIHHRHLQFTIYNSNVQFEQGGSIGFGVGVFCWRSRLEKTAPPISNMSVRMRPFSEKNARKRNRRRACCFRHGELPLSDFGNNSTRSA